MTTEWADPPLICICHIKAAIAADGRPISAAQATVMRFPVYPAGGLAAAIAVILLMWGVIASRFTLQRRQPS
ncbi:hypothetical protein ACIBG4_20930 [Nonomuraea sp. NPDC050383]|uniref:hypothetical protein n=1 Tax=Nonomuraea sp. NPDC050383 TaxID=3364362 RepID=UPI00379F3DB1